MLWRYKVDFNSWRDSCWWYNVYRVLGCRRPIALGQAARARAAGHVLDRRIRETMPAIMTLCVAAAAAVLASTQAVVNSFPTPPK